MTTPPRLLILYITAGDGHRRAAEAVANQLQSHGAHVSLLDAMPHAHPIFRAIYVRGGLGLILRLPRVFHAAYRLTDRSKIDRVIRGPRHRAQQLSTRSLLQAITAYQPDAIICTHFLPAEVCAGWQRSHQIKVPVYTIVTDFEPHRIWQHQGVAGYCVATDAAATRLMADGIDRSIIKVTGIPIQNDFAHLPDRATAINKLQLNPHRSTLLIMGGGLGVGKIEHIAQALIKKPIDAQIIFITGHNRVLRRQLLQLSPDWIVRGFVNNMHEWLAAADVAISKAGGLAASELLAAGVPMIIPPSLRGHETSNAQYVTARGAAIMTDSFAAAIDQAAELLRNRPLQLAMRAASLRAARPDAAEEVAEYVLREACGVSAKLVLSRLQYGSSQEFIRVENTPLSIP